MAQLHRRRSIVKCAAATAVLAAVNTIVEGSSSRAGPAHSNARTFPEIASGDPATPEFHGPRVLGATPGREFLFKVPHTGEAPVTISADGLPEGLTMDNNGLITGKINHAGEYQIRLKADNALGHAKRTLRLVAGEHKLALTPQMGWNSWYAYKLGNTAAHTMAAADAIVKYGLAAKGFMYVNLDDGWQAGRSANGDIQPIDAFGDMKKLADYVHNKGLRFGIYSSPGSRTCGGHTGSLGHEMQDAKTYARWGVDYLKYDWCSYGREVPKHPDLEQYIKPYQVMRAALDKLDRDMFFSLCQYGMGHVWTWGGKPPVWGNCYRISGDITDTWKSVCHNSFLCNGPLFPFAGPGQWNDPCMLMVGYGRFDAAKAPHWTRLTPNEQHTQVTLWCMMAAPLLLSCDLEKLNQFTLDLLTNTEVLAVNQDEVGRQAQRVDRQKFCEIWARPLWDGTVAVGIFNRGLSAGTVTIQSWDMLDPVLCANARPLRGAQLVRDLWKRKDVGVKVRFSAEIPAHGAVMIKVGTPNIADH